MTPQLESQIREWVAHSEGWHEPERFFEMAELILTRKPKVCAEIGVFGGRSLVCQAMALKEVGSGQIYGIDPWHVQPAIEGENDANAKWWKENVDLNQIHNWCMNGIHKYGLEKQAIVIRSCSQDCYRLFDMGIDHLNLDGNHSEVASCRDVEFYLPRLNPMGILLFDDANWQSTQKALAIISAQCDLVKDGGEYRIYRKR
jgi:hypothetical protein